MQVAPHAVKTVGVHAPTGQALHTVDMNALNMAGPADASGAACPAGPRSGRAACRARTARSRRGCLGRSRRPTPGRADRRDGREHAGAAHAAEDAHAARRGGARRMNGRLKS